MAMQELSVGQFRHYRRQIAPIEARLLEQGLDPQNCSDAEFEAARAAVAPEKPPIAHHGGNLS